MTEKDIKENSLTDQQKKLIFRSWHRGTREIDFLLGRFADAYVISYTPQECDLYERVLKNSDPDLYNWISLKEPVPPSEVNSVVEDLISFCGKVSRESLKI